MQHALRAYTPKDQKALKASAQSFRENPAFDTEEALQALGVGEALISVLDEKGVPTIVQKAGIMPPRSSMDAVEKSRIEEISKANPLFSKYSRLKDRESAYEVLQEEREEAEKEARKEQEREEKEKAKAAKEKTKRKTTSSGRKKSSALDKAISSAANTVGREIGKKLVRGILGSLKF